MQDNIKYSQNNSNFLQSVKSKTLPTQSTPTLRNVTNKPTHAIFHSKNTLL